MSPQRLEHFSRTRVSATVLTFSTLDTYWRFDTRGMQASNLECVGFTSSSGVAPACNSPVPTDPSCTTSLGRTCLKLPGCHGSKFHNPHQSHEVRVQLLVPCTVMVMETELDATLVHPLCGLYLPLECRRHQKLALKPARAAKNRRKLCAPPQ